MHHKKDIITWLEDSKKKLSPGHFRFCFEGNLVPTEGKTALFAACFGVKIAWQTGLWDEWPDDFKTSCVDFIKSFQGTDGYFVDTWLFPSRKSSIVQFIKGNIKAVKNGGKLIPFNEHKSKLLRAETRQAVATLYMIGERPNFPVSNAIQSAFDAKNYLNKLDWSNPWSAGSHLAHILCILKINKDFFSIDYGYHAITSEILGFLQRIYDENSGTWFQGNPQEFLKVNGAMKILSGLDWVDDGYISFDYRRLINFALRQPFEKDGCGFLNRLLVVYKCLEKIDYDIDTRPIIELLDNAKSEIIRFKKADGAFSFYHNKSQDYYSGIKVSNGEFISDLHGTVMICWALSMINTIENQIFHIDLPIKKPFVA